MTGLVKEIERQGPEVVGAPVRGVAMLARDVGGLFPAGEDGAFARRRRRATATQLARRAVSLAAAVHGVIDDRPELERAWQRNLAEVPTPETAAPEDCVNALARVAALALDLPVL